VTLSVGVASFPAQAGRSDQLVAHARAALDWARQHGGDRTFLYTADTAEILRAESREREVDDEAVLTTVATLASGIDGKHPATVHHHENVGRVAALIAAELGLAPDAVEDVRVAGLIHDVGKIGLDDAVLAADDEPPEPARTELRRHPEIGARMLAGSRLENVAPWVRHHHERMDGTGYPDGLAGEAIPLESRILAVADAWDHLRSGRWGGVRLTPADVMRELERRSGSEFDPVAVAALRALVGRGAAEAPRVP
jgi:HD-GYP domain-containing protein (c-di-GMP phosphodiesterase class II)